MDGKTSPPEDEVDISMKKLLKKLSKWSCGVVENDHMQQDADKLPYEPTKRSEPTNEHDESVNNAKTSDDVTEEGSSVDPPSSPPSPYDNDIPPDYPPPPPPPPAQDSDKPQVKEAKKILEPQKSPERQGAETLGVNEFEYDFRHKERGVFVMFNIMDFKGHGNMKREGTGEDARLMEETFTQMGFKVVRYDNPTAREILDILDIVAAYDHTHFDCVGVGILTHGSWEVYRKRYETYECITDIIVAYDQNLRLEDLTQPFRAGKCHKSLVGKPKLFFLQACRGEKLSVKTKYYEDVKVMVSERDNIDNRSRGDATDTADPVYTSEDQIASPGLNPIAPSYSDVGSNKDNDDVQKHSEEDRQDHPNEDWMDRQAVSLPESMPIYKDFLVAWSTPPGYFSFRNQDKGSIFLQTACRFLKLYHREHDLLSILTRVASKVAHDYESYAPSTQNHPTKRDIHQKKQMPWFFSRLTKEVVFRSKISLAW